MARFLFCLGVLGLFSGGTGQAMADYIFTTLAVDSANGINDSGQIVGRNGLAGFLYSGGSYTTIFLGTPNTDDTTAAFGINNQGQIVGIYRNPDGLPTPPTHTFLLSGGSYTTIDHPGSLVTAGSGINDAGQIVGYYSMQGGGKSFLLSGGSYTTIDVPGAAATVASGINNMAEIVGSYVALNGSSHGFLLRNGGFITIDVPGGFNADFREA